MRYFKLTFLIGTLALIATIFVASYKVEQSTPSPTPTATQQLFGGAPLGGLQQWWTYDSGTVSGTSVTDVSGTGNTGTTTAVQYGTGKLGTAVVFDGTNSTMTSAIGADAFTGLTVSFWVNLRVAGDANDRIIDQQDAGPTNGFTFSVIAGPAVYYAVRNLAVVEAEMNTVALNTGQWYHITGTYTLNSAKLYSNGVNIATDTSVTMTDSLCTFTIGDRCTVGLGNLFDGSVDDVRVYNRVLSASEIKDIYDAGSYRRKINEDDQ